MKKVSGCGKNAKFQVVLCLHRFFYCLCGSCVRPCRLTYGFGILFTKFILMAYYTDLISEFVKRYFVTARIVELWATEEIGRNGRPIDDHGILWNIRAR